MIDDIYAVYVFRPQKARGTNGVMLTEFLGIGDIRDILIALDSGVSQPIAFFPCCLPKIVPSYLFNEVSTMMIGGVWQKHRTIIPDEKWTLAAMFNVMQFFAYQSSQAVAKRVYFLSQFLHIYSKICPLILSKSPELQQCVLGDASDLKSDDVLHTLISLFYLKQH